MLRLLFAALVFCGLNSFVAAADWPAWRGPTGQGHCDEKGLPLTWSKEENVKWRVALEHFTPWDLNWPYGPPQDAIPPPVPPPTPDDAPRPKKECFGDGSIIACHSQRLGQELPVTGTGFSLDYWSDRVSGRLTKRALEIPLTPASVPTSLLDVKLEVTVAGRTFSHGFGPAPNQSFSFVWDGLDVYGRPTAGAQPVTIRVGYHYGLVKYDEPKALQAAFARIGGSWSARDASSPISWASRRPVASPCSRARNRG